MWLSIMYNEDRKGFFEFVRFRRGNKIWLINRISLREVRKEIKGEEFGNSGKFLENKVWREIK